MLEGPLPSVPRGRPLPTVVWQATALLATLCVGGSMAWLCRDYPARMPFLAPWDFSWPIFLAAALSLLCYANGLMRTAPAARPSRTRRCGFVAGVALIYVVLQTHFDYLAQHMFALTRVQHLVSHHLGPFLIALSWPGPTLRRGLPAPARGVAEARVVRKLLAGLQQPVIAGVLFVGLIFVWLIPPVEFRAMIDARLYALMNWSMVLDGLLFWTLVLDPRPRPPARLSRGGRLLLTFAVQWPQIAGGALICFAGRSLYPYYAFCGRLFPAIGDQADQQIGGFVIWFGGGMMSTVTAIILLSRLWAEEDGSIGRRITIREYGRSGNAPDRSSPSE